MQKANILVSGTSRNFSDGRPIYETVAEFAINFDLAQYRLVSNGMANFLVLFNHEKNVYRKFIEAGGDPVKTILIRLEPDTVFPAQYSSRIERKYGLVISLGASVEKKGRIETCGWPYRYHLNPSEPNSQDPELALVLEDVFQDQTFSYENWVERSHKLVMVAANKVSPMKNSNYAIRRKLASQMSPDLLEVYGPLWNESVYIKLRHRLAVLVAALEQRTVPNLKEMYASLFKRYRTTKGIVLDKHKLLKDTKFCLIVENSNSVVTEKVFDALINGSIPIYVGPNLEDFGVPKNIALQLPGNSKAIESVVEKLEERDVRLLLSSIQDFVSSDYFRMSWRSDFVYKSVSDKVKNYIDSIR
jgi:hypothetical protein